MATAAQKRASHRIGWGLGSIPAKSPGGKMIHIATYAWGDKTHAYCSKNLKIKTMFIGDAVIGPEEICAKCAAIFDKVGD